MNQNFKSKDVIAEKARKYPFLLKSARSFDAHTRVFQTLLAISKFFAKVSAIKIGAASVASAHILTGSDLALILPHDTASSGAAPASDPSHSMPVLI